MLPDMTIRKSLCVGACFFAASWIIPGIVAYGVIEAVPTPDDGGWGFLGVIVLGVFVSAWLHGMMLGVAFILPVATWIQSLNPGISARRVMTVGLIVWAVPAAFVAPMARSAANGVLLKRYTQEDCRKGLELADWHMATNREGRLMVHGKVLNRSPLVLSHLRIAIDGDPPRAKPLLCDPLRPLVTDGPEKKVGRTGPIPIGCFVTDPEEPILNPRATIVEFTCDGGR